MKVKIYNYKGEVKKISAIKFTINGEEHLTADIDFHRNTFKACISGTTLLENNIGLMQSLNVSMSMDLIEVVELELELLAKDEPKFRIRTYTFSNENLKNYKNKN